MTIVDKKIEENIINIERNFWWHKSRRKIIETLFLKKFKGKKLKILSVGCSSGIELELLQKYGDVTALDIDEERVKSAKKNGFNILHADLNKNPLPDNSYDLILAMDIIEHIKDDQAAIDQIHRLLKPKGKVIITVPALMSLWSAFDEYGAFPHHRRYNRKTLSKLLSPKFQIEKMSYYNFFLFPLIYLNRKLSKNPLASVSMPNKLINSILYFIFSSERFLLKYINLPIGSSLISISEKIETQNSNAIQ